MALQPYIIDPTQGSPVDTTTLGASGTAALAGGQLSVVSALPSDQTNWYFNFIGPSYQNYFDWAPLPDSGGNMTTPVGSSGPVLTVAPVPQPVAALPPASSASAMPGAQPVSGSSPTANAPSQNASATTPSPVTVVINVPGATDPSAASTAAPSASPVASTPLSTASGSTTTPAMAPVAPSVVAGAMISPVAAGSNASAAAQVAPAQMVAQPAPVQTAATPPVVTAPTIAVPQAAPAAPTKLVGASAAPRAIGAPQPAPDPIVTAVSYSPRFRESQVRSERDSLFEEMLADEDVSVHWVTHEAAPLPFAVPAGCNSVELFYGPVTVNPNTGREDDAEQMVMLGTPQIQHQGRTFDGAAVGELTPGSALLVTIPWRAASFVTLGAKRLMVTVYARFYANMQPLDDE